MIYNLKLYFVTDGDFGFSLVPPETKFNGEDYYLGKTFDSFSSLKDYLNKTIPGFLDNLSGRDEEVNIVREKLSTLLEHVNGENGEDDYYDYMTGNQDGTEFSYNCTYHLVNFCIYFNEDEYKEFQESYLSNEDIKNIIVNYIKNNKKVE